MVEILLGDVPRCGKVVSQEKLIEDLKREGNNIKISGKNNDDELDALHYEFNHVKKEVGGCPSFDSARKFQWKYQSAVKLLRVIKHELMTLNGLRLVDSNNDLVYVNFNDLLEKIEEVLE